MSALSHRPTGAPGPDPGHALTPSGNLRRRQLTSRLVLSGMLAAAGLAVGVLLTLLYYTAKQGIGQISLSFLTSDLPPYNGVGGGIGPALQGTVEMVMISTLIALPVGLLTAIYLSEFAGPVAAGLMRTALDLMAGLPTIVIGVVVYGLIANRFGYSGFAGGVALSIVQVPLIARASLESIRRVPNNLREASDALGVAHWRSVVGVILPTASNGIVTATLLAIARAAGETAPVLFTSSVFPLNYQLDPRHGMASIPMAILNMMNSGYPAAIDKAWGAAFFLIILILAINIAARVWLRRSERRRGL